MSFIKESLEKIKEYFKKFFYAVEGATLIEIALYIALVVIVCIVVVTALGDKLRSVFQTIVNNL